MADSSRPAALEVAAVLSRAATGAIKSPTKSPTKATPSRAAGGVLLRHSVDDVSYRQTDSTRADQARVVDVAPNAEQHLSVAAGASSSDTQSKYIHLLSSVYNHGTGSKPRSLASGVPVLRPHAAGTAGNATHMRHHQQAGSTPADGPPPPPLRSSGSPKGPGSKMTTTTTTTPVLRRSIRASILDSSQGTSLIPASPEPVAAATVAATSTSSINRPQYMLSPSVGGSGSNKAAAGMQLSTSPTVLSRIRTSTGSGAAGVGRTLQTKEPVSPVRRSAPAGQPKAQYAFGTRIEQPAAAVRRRPSPTRVVSAEAAGGSAGGTAAAQADRIGRIRTSASPQRVPSAARASGAGAAGSGSLRSASAPRMSSTEKAQSRFTQHAVIAAAAQRSKTPNPAQRAAAAAAAAASASSGGSGVNAARRLRQSAHATASESRHVARMRASDSAVGAGQQHSRLPGFSATQTGGSKSPSKGSPAGSTGSPASPVLRGGAAARSVLAAAAAAAAAGPAAAARFSSASRAIPAAPGSRVKPAAAATAAGRIDRVAMSLPGAGCIAADAAAAVCSQDCSPGVVVPVIKDRYKDLFKHTPAAIAVEEARAAAAAAGDAAAQHSRPRSAAVPKLSLGGLNRQSGEALAAPRGPSQQQQQQAGLVQEHQHGDEVASPYLGRISGLAAAADAVGADAATDGVSSGSISGSGGVGYHLQAASTSTPQRQPVPLLALSSITPVPRSRPALAEAAAEDDAATTAVPVCAEGGKQHSAEADLLPPWGVDLTPCPAATPAQDDTPNLLVRQQPRTGSSSKGVRGAEEEPCSPQLAPCNLSAGMHAAQDSSQSADATLSAADEQGWNPETGNRQGSSIAGGVAGGAGLSTGAKGFVLPTLQLQVASAAGHDTTFFESPPKHRRGERESPGGPVEAPSQHCLKAKANTVCSSSSAGGSHKSATTVHPTRTALPEAAGRAGGSSSGGKGGAVAAGSRGRQRVGGAAGSVLEAAATEPARGRVVPALRRSLNSLSSSSTSQGRSSLRVEPPGGSHSAKCTPVSSPSKKFGTPVPRLDLTPVLASMAAEQQTVSDREHHHQGPLLLEDAPRPRRLELDGDTDSVHDTHGGRQQQASGGSRVSGGKAHAGAGSGKGRGGSGKSHGLNSKNTAGPGSKSSQQSAEPPPQESFYVYESVMPPEEQRTYEELRRVLLKAPGGSKHAANLQGIWGCYHDARRNTEAMAFRGHRLLDQVSTEYGTFKRDAEVKLHELQQERDDAREELQLAMVAGSVPASALQLAAKDKQLHELQEENSLLRQQVTEMERALQMASDYHSATQAAHQAHQVPVHARVIAESATTNILTNLTLDQQMRLQQSEKRMEDMKAALHLACGVLRQTNYMDTHSDLRTELDPDTITVLDTIMATEEMEAGLAEAAAMQQQQQLLEECAYSTGLHAEASPAVHIEEVHELHGDDCLPR